MAKHESIFALKERIDKQAIQNANKRYADIEKYFPESGIVGDEFFKKIYTTGEGYGSLSLNTNPRILLDLIIKRFFLSGTYKRLGHEHKSWVYTAPVELGPFHPPHADRCHHHYETSIFDDGLDVRFELTSQDKQFIGNSLIKVDEFFSSNIPAGNLHGLNLRKEGSKVIFHFIDEFGVPTYFDHTDFGDGDFIVEEGGKKTLYHVDKFGPAHDRSIFPHGHGREMVFTRETGLETKTPATDTIIQFIEKMYENPVIEVAKN